MVVVKEETVKTILEDQEDQEVEVLVDPLLLLVRLEELVIHLRLALLKVILEDLDLVQLQVLQQLEVVEDTLVLEVPLAVQVMLVQVVQVQLKI
jgi:hypothetical protein